MNTGNLAEQIDKLVRDHLAQVRAEAAAAVERAFASSSTQAGKTKKSPRTREAGKRRDPAFVADLAERLRECILAKPGESMTVYAKQLGTSVRELHRPMTQLRRAGLLRMTGARNHARYYPAPGS